MEEKKLKDICEFIVDCPHSTAKDEGSGYPLIRTPNVGKGRLILQGVHRVNEQIYKTRIERATPSVGDIILAREAPVGNAAIIMPGQKVCLGQRVVLLRAKRDIVNPMFLVYYLLSNEVQHKLKNNANGAVVAHLNMDEIRNLGLSIPDIEIQDKIAEILSSIDDKIEVNRRINDNLEQQAQTLFKSWFVDFDPFRDRPFIESELGMIPEGWRVMRIEDLSQKMASGGTPKSLNQEYYSGDIRWFSTKELKDGYLYDSEKHISKEALNNSAAKLFPENTILMAIYASPTVGRLGILTKASTFNQAAVGIVPKQGVSKEFLYLSLLSERTNLNNLASGAAQQNLNVGIVKNYKIIVPSQDILDNFSNIVTDIFESIRVRAEQNLQLTSIRDAILPRLMSGELEVKDIEDSI